MQECKFKVGDVVKRVEHRNKHTNHPNNGKEWVISEVLKLEDGDWYLWFEDDCTNASWRALYYALVSRAEEKSLETQTESSGVVTTPVDTSTQWTDKHYDAYYHLTPKDIEAGKVKIDPYFVAKQWRLGEKDDTGVLFHNLKNISRYGEKNSKEREIKALYAQIKRLSELEGVEL